MNPLEERIGYKFRNSLLLAEALTHPSLRHETHRSHFDNQRLEFLGDAVLQLVVTEHLYSYFTAEAEGKLTKLRARLVSREALAILKGVAKEGIVAMEAVEVSPPYDISDITALMAVRAMVDVLATMVKHDRVGGKLQ